MACHIAIGFRPFLSLQYACLSIGTLHIFASRWRYVSAFMITPLLYNLFKGTNPLRNETTELILFCLSFEQFWLVAQK